MNKPTRPFNQPVSRLGNDTDSLRVILFIDFLRPCRWPISWLNRMVVFAARFSPLVRDAQRNQARWERDFYTRDARPTNPVRNGVE